MLIDDDDLPAAGQQYRIGHDGNYNFWAIPPIPGAEQWVVGWVWDLAYVLAALNYGVQPASILSGGEPSRALAQRQLAQLTDKRSGDDAINALVKGALDADR